MKKITEEQITKLEELGFKRWTKENVDRLYVNGNVLGLEIERRNSGSIFSAKLRGEKISNSKASKILSDKIYIDIETGKIFSKVDEVIYLIESIIKNL